MHIKITKTAKDISGNVRACKVKIDGVKYPRKFNSWYFVDSKKQAEFLALLEWAKLREVKQWINKNT